MSLQRRATRNLRVLGQELDAGLAPDKLERDIGLTVACRKGCAHCCRLLVTSTVPEAINMYTTASNQNGDFQRRIDQWSSQHAGPLLRGEITEKQWFEKQINCVFLKRNAECAVYASRPVNCRLHFALESPEHCAPTASTLVKRPDCDALRPVISARLRELARDCGLPVGQVPLPVGLSWAKRALAKGPAVLRRLLERDGIPAYDLVQHARFWEAKLNARDAHPKT